MILFVCVVISCWNVSLFSEPTMQNNLPDKNTLPSFRIHIFKVERIYTYLDLGKGRK